MVAHPEETIQLIEVGSSTHTEALSLRFEILREPLGMPKGSEVHESESLIWHFVALQGGKVVGCVLLLPNFEKKTGRLLQMAVEPSLQGQGLGRRLVLALESHAAEKGIRLVQMHARKVAIPFYEKLGYICSGEVFEEVGIPHRIMSREL